MRDFIKKLQAKSYDEKLKILWTAVIITAVALVVIWGLTLKFRNVPKGDTSKFHEIFNNLKQLRSKF